MTSIAKLADGHRSRSASEGRSPHTPDVGQTRESERLCFLRHSPSDVAISVLRPGCYTHSAVRCSRIEKEGSVRARNRDGSVVLDKRIKCWNFFLVGERQAALKENRHREPIPTKASAWRAAKTLRHSLENQTKVSSNATTVLTLVEQYRAEKMPTRSDTRRSYEVLAE